MSRDSPLNAYDPIKYAGVSGGGTAGDFGTRAMELGLVLLCPGGWAWIWAPDGAHLQ